MLSVSQLCVGSAKQHEIRDNGDKSLVYGRRQVGCVEFALCGTVEVELNACDVENRDIRSD